MYSKLKFKVFTLKFVENVTNEHIKIFLMWTNIEDETTARSTNINKNWSPNHFVPLLMKYNEPIMQKHIEYNNSKTINEYNLTETLNKKLARLKADRERKMNNRQNESLSEKKQRQISNKDRQKKRRQNETLEETSKRRKIEKDRIAKRRAIDSATQKSNGKKRVRKEEKKPLNDNWPEVTSNKIKSKLLKNFIQKMSKNILLQ